MARVKEIQKQIDEWESRLTQVGESQQKIQSRVSELQTERRGLIVEARTKKNEAAKNRIATIAGELDAANRELRDDADAVAECMNRLEPLRADLALAKKLSEAEILRQLVIAARDRNHPAVIYKLIRSLEAALADWLKAKAEVASELQRFDQRFANTAHALAGSYREPVRIDYATNDFLESFRRCAPSVFDAALGDLDHFLQSEGSPAAQPEAKVEETSAAPAKTVEKMGSFDVVRSAPPARKVFI